jgi:adenosylcobinamide-GDP ribazoletransferase
MVVLPYVSHDDRSKSRSVARARAAQAIVATLWAAAAFAIAVRLGLPFRSAAWAFCASIVCAAICGVRFLVRAGGITGDFLGATEQLAECTILLAFAVTA